MRPIVFEACSLVAFSEEYVQNIFRSQRLMLDRAVGTSSNLAAVLQHNKNLVQWHNYRG